MQQYGHMTRLTVITLTAVMMITNAVTRAITGAFRKIRLEAFPL